MQRIVAFARAIKVHDPIPARVERFSGAGPTRNYECWTDEVVGKVILNGESDWGKLRTVTTRGGYRVSEKNHNTEDAEDAEGEGDEDQTRDAACAQGQMSERSFATPERRLRSG
jgi:hypothetical protein